MTLKPIHALLLTVAAGTLAPAALAQTNPAMANAPAKPAPTTAAPATPAAPAAQPMPPSFSEEEFGTVARMLTGCWKATVPGSGDVVLGIAPVKLKGMGDCLYAELSRADTMNRPFRQTIWQIHKVNGKVRIKTLEFRTAKGRADHVAGLWAAPDAFPGTIGQDDLVATMDLELTKDGSGYKGKTLQPYPTTLSGAVEMTGEVAFDGNSFSIADRGFNDQGKQVWGPATGEGYTFKRFDEGPRTLRLDGGVIVVDYPGAPAGAPAAAGQTVSVEYIGYLEDGKIFDASYERGVPFTFTKGDAKLLDGWNRAMDDARKGQTRRIVIPGAMGVVRKDAKAPVGATLYYDVRVIDVGAAKPVVQTSDNSKPVMQPVDPNSQDPGFLKAQENFRRQMEDKQKAKEAEKAKQDAASQPAKPAEPAPKK